MRLKVHVYTTLWCLIIQFYILTRTKNFNDILFSVCVKYAYMYLLYVHVCHMGSGRGQFDQIHVITNLTHSPVLYLVIADSGIHSGITDSYNVTPYCKSQHAYLAVSTSFHKLNIKMSYFLFSIKVIYIT